MIKSNDSVEGLVTKQLEMVKGPRTTVQLKNQKWDEWENSSLPRELQESTDQCASTTEEILSQSGGGGWGGEPARNTKAAKGKLTLLIIFLGCCEKLPPTWWFKTTQIYFLTVWKPEVWHEGIFRDGSLWRLRERTHFKPLS